MLFADKIPEGKGLAKGDMNLRLKIAFGVFLVGFTAMVLVVPVNSCTGIGFRGTPGPNFSCTFEGYLPVTRVSELNRGTSVQGRIAHGRFMVQLGMLLLISGLIAFDWRSYFAERAQT